MLKFEHWDRKVALQIQGSVMDVMNHLLVMMGGV